MTVCEETQRNSLLTIDTLLTLIGAVEPGTTLLRTQARRLRTQCRHWTHQEADGQGRQERGLSPSRRASATLTSSACAGHRARPTPRIGP